MTEPLLSVALCVHNHADRLVLTLGHLRNLESPSRPSFTVG